ncbi:hypothetical protein IVB30_05080 [Bradyrhizobium sp. 200]|uniref:hypothetical protein n=1 Tax=Bradyrhizobium sp. 200 TaxID=2782665 RepID=UPI001FFE48E0|nr:hypothetical protein [Bradyrhizobium sp. 200]UPJ50777.1 hypothetical protein IVB30_05080 [Bradyrhizobium sp. 200]
MARNSFGAALVQAFIEDSPEPFVALANGNADVATLARLLTLNLTKTQRNQLRWRAQYQILRETMSSGAALLAIGRAEYGERFEMGSYNALSRAIAGRAGPRISGNATLFVSCMSEEQKAQFVKHLVDSDALENRAKILDRDTPSLTASNSHPTE